MLREWSVRKRWGGDGGFSVGLSEGCLGEKMEMRLLVVSLMVVLWRERWWL